MNPTMLRFNCGESATFQPLEFERFDLRLGFNSLEFEGISLTPTQRPMP